MILPLQNVAQLRLILRNYLQTDQTTFSFKLVKEAP